MHRTTLGCVVLALVSTTSLGAQTIQCIQPPALTPAQSACQAKVVPGSSRELVFVLQLRGPDDKPSAGTSVTLSATEGTLPKTTLTTDSDGYFYPVWKGDVVPDRSITITATA